MAAALRSSDAAVWREAQVRLAHAGPAALAAMEAQPLLEVPEFRARVRDVVQQSLGRCITPRELGAHPRLMALVADSIARGIALAPVLAGQRLYPGPDAYDSMVWWEDPHPVPPRPEDQMFALGGCAVPAALLLLREPRPVGRAFGIGILNGLGAVAMIDSVAPLVSDAAEFGVDHNDFEDRETVGQRAKVFVASIDQVLSYRCFVYESGLESDLINGIRQTSNATRATSWDQWWNEARPAWRDWWRLAGDGPRPPDREAWLNAVNEYHGFHLFRVPNAEPRMVVRVTGPTGTHARIETESTVVAQGEVPLEVLREQDSVSVARRMAREMRKDYSDRTYIVTATLPDGRKFRNEFFWQQNTLHTVELLPRLKPRRP
jgi:hypothetical protein